MNVYCKIMTQEDYDYFFQYDPDNRHIQCPCLFKIDTGYLDNRNDGVGILVYKEHTLESSAEWITVEEMKQLAFIRSLEL